MPKQIRVRTKLANDATADALAIRYGELLKRQLNYMLNGAGRAAYYDEYIRRVRLGHGNHYGPEPGIRGAGFQAFAMATALMADLIPGSSVSARNRNRVEMERRIHEIVTLYCGEHMSNKAGNNDDINPTGWGWQFASGQEASSQGFAAFLAHDLFTDAEHQLVKNVIIKECDGLAFGQYTHRLLMTPQQRVSVAITAPPVTRPSGLPAVSSGGIARAQATAQYSLPHQTHHEGDVVVVITNAGGGYDKANPPTMTLNGGGIFKDTKLTTRELRVFDDGTIGIPPIGSNVFDINDDSSADNLAWHAWPLEIAMSYMPDHPHREMWLDGLIRYRLTCFAAMDDVNDVRVVDGKQVKEWITQHRGVGFPCYNSYNGYGNHGVQTHPQYMVGAIRSPLLGALFMILGGNAVPQFYGLKARENWNAMARDTDWQTLAGSSPEGAVVQGRILNPNGVTQWSNNTKERNRRGNWWTYDSTAALNKKFVKEAGTPTDETLETGYLTRHEGATANSGLVASFITGVGTNQNCIRDTTISCLLYYADKNKAIEEVYTPPAKADETAAPTVSTTYSGMKVNSLGGSNPVKRALGSNYDEVWGEPLETFIRFKTCIIYGIVFNLGNIPSERQITLYYTNTSDSLIINLALSAAGVTDTFNLDFNLVKHYGQELSGGLTKVTLGMTLVQTNALINILGGNGVISDTHRVSAVISDGTPIAAPDTSLTFTGRFVFTPNSNDRVFAQLAVPAGDGYNDLYAIFGGANPNGYSGNIDLRVDTVPKVDADGVERNDQDIGVYGGINNRVIGWDGGLGGPNPGAAFTGGGNIVISGVTIKGVRLTTTGNNARLLRVTYASAVTRTLDLTFTVSD